MLFRSGRLGVPVQLAFAFTDEKTVKKDWELAGRNKFIKTGLQLYGSAGEVRTHKLLTGDFKITIDCIAPDATTVRVCGEEYDIGTPKRWAIIQRSGNKLAISNDSGNNKVVELKGDIEAPADFRILMKVEIAPTPKPLELRQVKIEGFEIGQ